MPAASSLKREHTAFDGSDPRTSGGGGDVTAVTHPTDPVTGAKGWHGHNPRRQGFGSDGDQSGAGDEPAVNAAPTIGGVPAEGLTVSAGQTVALPGITVDDPEDGILTAYVSASNGVINGLPADPTWPGVSGHYTLTGTEGEINAQLAAATFTATTGGAGEISVSVSDGLASSYESMAVTVTNEAPVLSGVPAGYVTVRPGIAVALPDITVDDPEDGLLTLRLGSTGGSLGGLSLTPEVQPDGYTLYTMTGTEQEINAVLANLTYTADGETWGTVDMDVIDQAGAMTSVNYATYAFNQGPVFDGVPTETQSVRTGVPAALPAFTVDDPEDGQLTVRLTTNGGTIQGLPATAADYPWQRSYLLTGTEAEINAQLAAATYTADGVGWSSIDISAQDDHGWTSYASINLDAVNEAPVISGMPTDVLYASVGQATPVPGITVDDPEDGSLTVRLTVSNGTLGGLSADPVVEDGATVYTLTGTEAEINADLADLTYTPDNEWGGSFDLSVQDAGGGFAYAYTPTQGTDYAPVIGGLPEGGAVTVQIGRETALPDITVDDPENGILTVRLSTHTNSINGLPRDPASQDGLSVYVLTGTAADVNAQLAAATYMPTAEGWFNIDVWAEDSTGHSSAASFAMMVTDDPPTIGGWPEGPLTVTYGSVMALPGITVDEPEDSILTIRLATSSGIIEGLPRAPDAGPNDLYYELTGTEAEINAALAAATYRATREGPDSIFVQTVDGTNLPTQGTIEVNVVNGAPTISGVPEGMLEMPVGRATALPAITVDDPDGNILSVRVSVINGFITGLPQDPNVPPDTPYYLLTGTADEINALLAAATYTAGYEGQGILGIAATDGAAYTNNFDIPIMGTNHAPVVSGLPEGALSLRSGVATALPAITIDDPEDGIVTVQLYASNGTIEGLPYPDWAGPTTGVYEVTGTEQEINALLADATFTAYQEGAGYISVQAWDQGSHLSSAQIDFTVVNETPVIGGLPEAPLSVHVGVAAPLPAITVDDPEDGVLFVQLQSSDGTIDGLPLADGIPAWLGIYEVTGTEQEINARLANATFTAAYEGQGNIWVQVRDQGYRGASAQFAFTAADWAPVIGGLPDQPLSAPVGKAVALPAITIDDPEDGLLTVELSTGNGTIAGLPIPDGYGPEAGFYRLVGTEQEINAQLAGATITPSHEGTGYISISAWDSGGHYSSASLSLTGTNEAPVVATPPAPFTLAVGEVAALSGISVDDPEDGLLTLEIDAANVAIHGVPVQGQGYGPAWYAMSDTEAEINARLAEARFTVLYEAASQIQFRVWDSAGHYGASSVDVYATPEIVVDETVYGTAQGELLSGGGGNDVLIGGGGDDLLVGGGGEDLFVIGSGAGHDEIADFRGYAGDRIAVASDLTYTIGSDSLGQALISFSDGSSLTLREIPDFHVSSSWLVAA
ncbi:hypothetical protein [Azospirillum sp.]|uniref:hypothetical protein n=1 Tax=Azospirillum sp. TaxID=34012 RepID=UPI003D7202F2